MSSKRQNQKRSKCLFIEQNEQIAQNIYLLSKMSKLLKILFIKQNEHDKK